MQETWVPSLRREEPLENEMATHSSILPWRIPWTEEPGGLQSLRWQKVRHDLATECGYTHTHRSTEGPTPGQQGGPWFLRGWAILRLWGGRSCAPLRSQRVGFLPASPAVRIDNAAHQSPRRIEVFSLVNHPERPHPACIYCCIIIWFQHEVWPLHWQSKTEATQRVGHREVRAEAGGSSPTATCRKGSPFSWSLWEPHEWKLEIFREIYSLQ